MSGRLPVKSGEIALSKSIANKLLSSPENLVGYDIDVYSDRYEQKFTIVGITNDYTNVYKDDLNNPVAQEKLYDDRLSFNSIAIFNSKYSGRRINEIVTNKDFLLEGSSFDQSYMAFTYIRTIGTISLFLIGPVALILIFFQFVNAKQEIVSHRRIIGILKSMSISNSKIKRVFIIDLLIENGLSFILGIILSKPGINVINSIFIDRDVAPYDVIAYKPLILFVLIAIIIIISYISILITSWRLNRKSDIDLVHER